VCFSERGNKSKEGVGKPKTTGRFFKHQDIFMFLIKPARFSRDQRLYAVFLGGGNQKGGKFQNTNFTVLYAPLEQKENQICKATSRDILFVTFL
jgi:hypothetical protein